MCAGDKKYVKNLKKKYIYIIKITQVHPTSHSLAQSPSSFAELIANCVYSLVPLYIIILHYIINDYYYIK